MDRKLSTFSEVLSSWVQAITTSVAAYLSPPRFITADELAMDETEAGSYGPWADAGVSPGVFSEVGRHVEASCLCSRRCMYLEPDSQRIES